MPFLSQRSGLNSRASAPQINFIRPIEYGTYPRSHPFLTTVPSGNTSSAIACLLFCHHKDHNSVWLASPIQYFSLQYLKFTECFTLFKQLDLLAEISKCLALFNSLLTCPFISSKMKVWRPMFIEISVGKNTLSLCRYQVGGDHPFHPRPWTTKLYCLWKKIPSKCRLNLIP